MKSCWSCGTITPNCYDGCECAKCVDPEDYADWKYNNPEEYQNWLDEQNEDDY